MALFNFFKSKSTISASEKLYGRWRLIRAEGDLDIGEGVTMEFRRNGTLDYCIDVGSKVQIMKLIFRVEGNMIITDQPSTPSEQNTTFSFDEKEHLLLDYGSSKAWFEKLTS
ncbi:MAG: hypothetical protein ACYC7L_05515 [Nitrospirota bacterium]